MPSVVDKLVSGLLLSKKYSDLTIICGEKAYQVHRAIVCSHSTFFEKACEGNFCEAQTKIITLSDDDPKAVSKMISFMYTQDYDDQHKVSHSVSRNQQVAGSDSLPTVGSSSEATDTSTPKQLEKVGSTTASTTPSHQTGSLNVRVYVLAEKYDINPLKKLAKMKFDTWAQIHWRGDAFALVLREIFETAPEHDRGLHEIVDYVVARHAEVLLPRPDFQDIIEDYRFLGTTVMRRILKLKVEMEREVDKSNQEVSKLRSTLEMKEMNSSVMNAINDLEACQNCRSWFNLRVHLNQDLKATLECKRCYFVCERIAD